MQELFIEKIKLFKFLYVSDKAGLDQLKIITTTRSTCFSESFHLHPNPFAGNLHFSIIYE